MTASGQEGDWVTPLAVPISFRALIPGFSQLTVTAMKPLLCPSKRNGVPEPVSVIDTVDVQLDESPNNLVSQDAISNTYKGTYMGESALFKQYRPLERLPRQGIDVKKVAISQTFLRQRFQGPGLVHLVGIWKPCQGSHDRTFLVELPVPGSVVLTKYLAQASRARRWLLLKDVVEAVAHLHSNDLVLGPIRQQSVTVAPNGRAYLCNFDCLRPEDPAVPFSPMVDSLDAFRYVAPEIVQALIQEDEANSHPSLTKASDVYSLGLLIFELFTDRVPFAKYTQHPRHLHALLEKITEGGFFRRPEDTHSQDSGLPEDVWVAVKACCARDPAARPSVSDLLELSPLQGLVDDR